jgi:hypothetical protein
MHSLEPLWLTRCTRALRLEVGLRWLGMGRASLAIISSTSQHRGLFIPQLYDSGRPSAKQGSALGSHLWLGAIGLCLRSYGLLGSQRQLHRLHSPLDRLRALH